MAGLHMSAVMDDEALRELKAIERRFPREFSRALNAIGFFVSRKLRESIRKRGPDGHKWQPLSKIHRSRKLDEWQGRLNERNKNTDYPMQNLLRAMRYKKVQGGKGVIMGATRRSTEAYVNAVQDGSLLLKQEMTQPVTPKVRRMFFLAGMPLKGRVIRRVRRPLIKPVAEKYDDAMLAFMRERVRVLLLGPYEKRDVTAARVGLK